MYLPMCLLMLLLSLNVCIARPLVAVEEAHRTQVNISGKVLDNAKKQPIESNGVTKTEDIIGAMEQMQKDCLKGQESTKKREISMKSVSWSVPHSKVEGQNPGFYSDYSRPRTRPPSHN